VDEVIGLELGADDYIQKPISPRKLVARVKAILRRHDSSPESGSEPTTIRIGRIEINRTMYSVKLGNRELFLPRKEFEVLALLAGSPGESSHEKISSMPFGGLMLSSWTEPWTSTSERSVRSWAMTPRRLRRSRAWDIR